MPPVNLNHASRPRPLPEFLGVGPQRTGTTWLHNVLAGHVGLPFGIKETLFFSHRYANGVEWFDHHFERCSPDLPAGEIGSTYFEYPHATERVYGLAPKCRIICSFRDPVDRSYSHYKFMRRNAYTKFGFEQALERHKQIAEANRYAFYLKDWQARFGKENVLVCIYDDLRSDPQEYIDRISNFIGIAPFPLAAGASERANAITHAPRSHHLAQNARHLGDWLKAHGAYETFQFLGRAGVWKFCQSGGEEFRPLTPEVDARVRARFLPEVEALEELIQRDLSSWKRPRVPRANNNLNSADAKLDTSARQSGTNA